MTSRQADRGFRARRAQRIGFALWRSLKTASWGGLIG